MSYLSHTDPTIASYLEQELHRQQTTLEMIPSENFVSPAVLEALGSIGTNKYSEGYAKQRYYGGNEFIDQIEVTAQQRAKKLFGVSHANVQPYSGSPANQAVCFALLEPGEKIMGLHLTYGGHLTHGWKVNFSGHYYTSCHYTSDAHGWLDYDAIEAIVRQEKPRLLFAGATAYPRIFDWEKFRTIANSVNAYLVADISHIAGLIVGKRHPSPVGFADIITTTTHKTLRGPRGAMILCNGLPSEPMKAPPEKSNHYFPTLIDRAVFPGLQGGPHNHQTAAIAVALAEADTDAFRDYTHQIVANAQALATELLSRGYDLVTGGTDNHLMLIDLTKKNVSGKIAETALDRAGITVNKNTIPNDPRKPYDPSGIRLGTPALTSRGMKEPEMQIIGQFIDRALCNTTSDDELKKIRAEIKELTEKFPLYQSLSYL